MNVFKDERFKHVVKDPKFRNVPKNEKKVTIDKRFQAMFTDEKFKLKYAVDQRGRPVKHSQAEDLKKYYDLSEESDDHEVDQTVFKTKNELKPKKKDSAVEKAETSESEDDNESMDQVDKAEETDFTPDGSKSQDLSLERDKLSEKVLERLQNVSVDYARGEGLLDSDSSSSDEQTTEDSEEEIEHNWGELDKDAELTEEATERIAVCHLDWDRVSAKDIMVLLHSFLPPTGFIQSVTIYPSEFGLQRMKEEEMKGPQELTARRLEVGDDKEESDEDDEYHREKLREYQIKRLKYYYAVVVFNSVESANKVYSECDRMEYESSATRLDLRFIPDDMTFDQEAKEVCTSLPEAGKYKPRLFANSALQQEKVELTWDETDPNRLDLTRKLVQGAAVPDSDLKSFIAMSSEESDSDDQHGSQGEFETNEGDKEEDKGDVGHEGDDISKYRSLLAGIQKDEEKKEKSKVQMEISWDLALESKAKSASETLASRYLTPFQKLIKSKQDKKKNKSGQGLDSDNLLSDDELPSDVDLDDPFFNDELRKRTKSKKNSMKKKKNTWTTEDNSDDEEEKKRKAELELLLAEDEEEDGKKHFSLKAIQERESKENKKSKGKRHQEEDDFKIDLKDDRFGALFTSHHYNVDPADSHFRKTKAMDDIIAEKSKRRRKHANDDDLKSSKKLKSESQSPQLSPEVTQLLYSVKKKSKINRR